MEQFGDRWYPKTLLSEIKYFLKFLRIEEVDALAQPRSATKFKLLLTQLKIFTFIEENNTLYIIITDDGKKMLKSFFTAVVESNPNKDYSHLFAVLEDGRKFKPKHFLEYLYYLTWLHEDMVSLCLSAANDLSGDNFGSDIKFIFFYNHLENIGSFYEDLTEEIKVIQKILHINYFAGNSIGDLYSKRALDLIKKHLVFNSKNGFYAYTNGFVYIDVIFGDVRICRTIENYLY